MPTWWLIGVPLYLVLLGLAVAIWRDGGNETLGPVGSFLFFAIVGVASGFFWFG